MKSHRNSLDMKRPQREPKWISCGWELLKKVEFLSIKLLKILKSVLLNL